MENNKENKKGFWANLFSSKPKCSCGDNIIVEDDDNRRPLADVVPRLLLPAALLLPEGKPKRFSCWVPAVPNARKHTG